ncbi:hypothetical protein EDD18DRAFT_1129630 [Armillaria luteobubalina]|uniref:Uncharacterized protein n=1 Tax=Armillaria luteobubalina TaxID=153913 RepID=A0AA39QNG7_9AGAR|nr:hypothetical protein EDD18DRAFT_1129630 [Armillaria luteobubalina]
MSIVPVMSPSLQDSLPLITPRIRFHPYHARPLPTITPRVRYGDLVQGRKRYEESIRARQQEHVDRREDPRNGNPGGDENRMSETREAGNGGSSDRLSPSGEEPSDDPGPGLSGKTDPYDPYSKPTGQPSRPRSGGYSMRAKLLDEHGWTKEEWKTVSVGFGAQALMIDSLAHPPLRIGSPLWRKQKLIPKPTIVKIRPRGWTLLRPSAFRSVQRLQNYRVVLTIVSGGRRVPCSTATPL